jgi:polyphenol oxidase
MTDSQFRISVSQNFLYHQQLASFKWMLHGFSLRFDPELKRDLNLALNDYQPAEIVLENRKRLALSVSGLEIPLVTLSQVHSERIFVIRNNKPFATAPEGDAMITVQAGMLLAIQTADCLPVFLIDPSRKVIAAIHAGWRGLLKRILMKTIEQMQKDFSTVPADCLAVIGPGIGPCCYEVGEEMVYEFTKAFVGGNSFFRDLTHKDSNSPTTKSLNLTAAAKRQLLESGLLPQSIFGCEACTGCRTDLFFSHRAEGRRTGRMMGVIGIKGAHGTIN